MPAPPTPVAEPRARWGEGEGFLRAVLEIETDSCVRWPYGKKAGYPELNRRLPDGNRRPMMVHIIVCEAFHGPRPAPGMEATHECGNPLCVNPRHLSWKTHQANCADRRRHGTENIGVRNGRHKLSEADVREIRALWDSGVWFQTELGREFGVTPQAISRIVGRRRWRHVA